MLFHPSTCKACKQNPPHRPRPTQAARKMTCSLCGLQIERGFNAIRALVKAGGLKPGLLQETVVAWCKSGHTNSAEEMMQFAMDSGIQVPDTAFSSLMLGRVHERHIEGAHKSLGMMWERKLVPDVQVINRWSARTCPASLAIAMRWPSQTPTLLHSDSLRSMWRRNR